MDTGTYNVEAAAQAIHTEILNDIEEGILPGTVSNFTDLHDHIDANDYLTEQNVPWGTDLPAQDDDPAGVRIVRAVQDRVNELMAARIQH